MCKINLEEFKKEIPEIFAKVKKDVKAILGLHRAGLSLGLVEMGMFGGGFTGGMHFYPGTDIVVNKTPLKLLIECQPYEIVWAYTYHILLGLYIHSLGVSDELQRRDITLRITEEVFKEEDHPAVILAKNGIGTFIPKLNLVYLPPEQKPKGISIEYIYNDYTEDNKYYI